MSPATRRGTAIPGLLLLLTSSISACTAGIRTGIEEPVVPRGPIPIRTLAVMPVTTETGSEGIRPGLALALRDVLQERLPQVTVMGVDEARVRLAGASAARDYADLLDDFERTGIVDPDRLSRITEALQADHFIQVRATYLNEDFLDTLLFDDEVVMENRQVLALVVRLWGGGGTGPLWEAVVRTTSETDDFDIREREVHELIQAVVEGLAERVPVDHGPSPGAP